MQLREAPLAIVDLETTGGHPAHDRITEIAVLEVEGFEVKREWSSLVNPGRSIPGAIQALTGITQEMVEDAPRFEELAADLHQRLAGRVFVAHNAHFDYGFLRHEFERAGLPFRAQTLCTVKLSRRLYRGASGHSLDALIARHGIRCDARHRALGDAEAAWQFLRIAAGEHGDDILDVAARQVAKEPRLPPHLERAAIDAVPEAAGVYFFYGDSGAPLYIGKSRSMRTRVLSHFTDPKPWIAQVRRIEWQRTAGELGALLREARLVKELRPLFNRHLRKPNSLCAFVFDGTRLEIADAEGIEADALDSLRGLYRSRRAAQEALRAIADEEKLCLQALGLERAGHGACFRQQIGRCAGVCAGRESIHQHHARLAAALARLEALHWPYRGAVGIVDEDRDRESSEVHLVDRWCYLGSADSESDLAEMLQDHPEPRFDYDHYRILARHLGKRGVRVVQLGRLMHCELVVPGLLSGKSPGRYATIELLLGRGRRQAGTTHELESFLMKIFGLEGENVPAGALTLLAGNGDPGDDPWLRADPVHLRLMRDRLLVMPAEALALSREEAAALTAALNEHFAGTLDVRVIEPRRWCARIKRALAINQGPALEHAGREVLPGDSLLNEIQMLLHAHPVNEAREARGEPVVNSLWPWGAGSAPKATSPWNSVAADDPIALGLARLGGARYATLPASAAAWLERAPEDGRHLVVLDGLRAPAALGDEDSFQKNLQLLETAWFAPVLAALRSQRIGLVTVHVPDGAVSFETARGDLRRFWRRARPLHENR